MFRSSHRRCSACNFIKRETLAQVFSCEFCKISKNTYSGRTPPVAAFECSRNLECEKQTDQNFITKNLCHGKEYCILLKRNLKQCQKEIICEYILAFAGWWSIFWELVGSDGYILPGGGWWWIYFGWWWVVVDIFWLVVSGAGYLLDGGGFWWMVVGRGGSWHSLV